MELKQKSPPKIEIAGNQNQPGKPAIIFDFGGVLLDWNPRYVFLKYFNGDASAVEKFLAEIDFFTWNYEQDKGGSFADAVGRLSKRFPHYSELIKAYDDQWSESIGGPIQATVNTLQPLKDNGYPLYGLTNWSRDKFGYLDNQYDFLALFDNIVVSGIVGVAKPDPRIFELMLSKIGRPANECVFIDDSQGNIDVAQKMGFKTIRFESTTQMLKELGILGITFEQRVP